MTAHHHRQDSEELPSESNPKPSLLSKAIEYQLPKDILELIEQESRIDRLARNETDMYVKFQLRLKQQSILKLITKKFN